MKRTLSLVLLLATLLTAVSCGEAADNNDGASAVAAETTAVETTAELSDAEKRLLIPDNLPESDFEGRTFGILARTRSDFVSDIGLDLEESGDVVDDAIISRNTAVEERFNTTLSAAYQDDPIAALRSSVLAGEDAYQVMLGQAIEVGSAALDGNYLNWYDLPFVDLSQPWYISNAVEALSIQNRAYIMAGEYDLSILRFTYCMFYNKMLAENYGFTDINTIVTDGVWTFDKLIEMTTPLYSDLNGNGTKDEEDQFGFGSDTKSAAITYQYAFNNPVMKKDKDGVPEVVYMTDKMVAIVEKLVDFFYNNPGSCAGDWGAGYDEFEAGHCLFYNTLFQSAEGFREVDAFDFGIIPYPKWNEDQDSYYTMSDGAHDLQCVPITVSDLEFASIIIEALNAESYKQVIPAYYDVALKVKFTRDEESVQVLDKLLDARTFDFGYIYDGWKGYAFLLQSCTGNNKTDIASAYASREKSAEKQYGDVIDMLLGIE